MSNLAQRISDIDAEINRLQGYIANRQRLENQWRTSLNTCNQVLKKKRDACEQDNQYRLGKANGYKEDIVRANANLKDLREQRSQFVDLLEAETQAKAQATINLSEQGMSHEALVEEARGQADAARELAALQGQATLKTAEEGAKSQTYLFIAIGLAVLIAAGIFAWTKFKKK